MIKVNNKARPLVFTGEDGEKITIQPSNMGEPYRDGLDISVEDGDDYFGAFLELDEVRRLYASLGEYLNVK